ncbi:MAG: penicillin-binding protein activator LpoB [Treponema sp.]|nr:penicillin-binding protein activator LpoB [Treponema sp.]MCL2272278.1 penicillin-binding protein activator LpoB [Treponema sp.]
MNRIFLFAAALFLILSSCSSSTDVRRVDPSSQIDLSGYWNDVDVKIVCDALVRDCLSSPRIEQAIRTKTAMPSVMVGRFRNESSEHIDTGIISSIMETAIFNSGRMNFVTGGSVRDEIRAERQDQQIYASEETMAKLRNETGADFILTGAVRSIVDRDSNQTVRTYFVTAELADIETNQRIWMGQNNEIKKVVTVPRNRF